MPEIKLSVIQICHTGQALTQSIEADHIGVHLPDAHGQRVDLFLQNAFGVFDLAFLLDEFSRPIAQLINGIAHMPGAKTHSDGERSSEDSKHQHHRHRQDDRVMQVKLFHSARLATDKNDIHTAYTSNAEIMLKTGGSRRACVIPVYRVCPGALRVDYAENLLKTRI